MLAVAEVPLPDGAIADEVEEQDDSSERPSAVASSKVPSLPSLSVASGVKQASPTLALQGLAAPAADSLAAPGGAEVDDWRLGAAKRLGADGTDEAGTAVRALSSRALAVRAAGKARGGGGTPRPDVLFALAIFTDVPVAALPVVALEAALPPRVKLFGVSDPSELPWDPAPTPVTRAISSCCLPAILGSAVGSESSPELPPSSSTLEVMPSLAAWEAFTRPLLS